MKKEIFLVAVFCMFWSVSSQAQLRFGVKAGANINNISFSEESFSTDNVTGFQVGATLEWMMLGNLGFDASVLYSQKGIKMSGIDDLTIDKNVGYLDIPVNLKFMLPLSENFKPFATAGPYISFNLSDAEISDQWEAQSFGAGINVGAGIELFKLLQVGANYGIGLTDDYKTIAGTTDYTAKSRTWSITAAVYF